MERYLLRVLAIFIGTRTPSPGSFDREYSLMYFIRENINVQLTSCLTTFDSTVPINLLLTYQINWTKASQFGGKLYIDTSPYEVIEYLFSVEAVSNRLLWISVNFISRKGGKTYEKVTGNSTKRSWSFSEYEWYLLDIYPWPCHVPATL